MKLVFPDGEDKALFTDLIAGNNSVLFQNLHGIYLTRVFFADLHNLAE